MPELDEVCIEYGPRDSTLLVEVNRKCKFDLAPVAGRREVCRPDNDARGPFPQQDRGLGVKEAARHGDRQEVPSQVALLGRAAAVDEDRYLSLAQPVLLLE